MPQPRQRVEPGPGQESVWDYPRPPRLERVRDRLVVQFGGETIADTTRGHRVLETSHPPVYVFPAEDVRTDLLERVRGRTICEFKGQAHYFDILAGGRRAERAAWCYPDPTPAYADISGDFSFYASAVDACFVGEERVQPQEGDFYGGWITRAIVGPFKGAAGTWGW
jgi:uncharacterized protein (DUF427 family)